MCNQFLVGVVAVVDLAVGDARREQRLDGAEQRDGDGGRDQLAEVVDRQWRDAERRQFLRDAVEAAADGFDREFEEPCHERSHDEDGERPRRPAQQRETLRESIVGEQEDQAADGESERRQVDGMGVGGEGLDAGEEFRRQVVDLQAEEILDLRHEDDDGDTVGETDDDGDRDEADQLPHARDAHCQQKGASQHGRTEQVHEAVGGNDAVNDRDECAGGAADLHARAAEERGQQAGDDGGPDAGGRGTAAGDGEGHGERQGENADGDARSEVLAELRARVVRQAFEELGAENDAHGGRSQSERRILFLYNDL